MLRKKLSEKLSRLARALVLSVHDEMKSPYDKHIEIQKSGIPKKGTTDAQELFKDFRE